MNYCDLPAPIDVKEGNPFIGLDILNDYGIDTANNGILPVVQLQSEDGSTNLRQVQGIEGQVTLGGTRLKGVEC